MFEFLKRHRIKDRAALRQSLLDKGHSQIPHHDSTEFDDILSTVLTQDLVTTDLSSHFEPMPEAPDTSPSIDTSFDPGGGESGGGGADGSW